MKTDSLFYKLFQQSPQLVLELAGISPRGAEDYQFRSEEIKQTAFRLDGVLLPPPDRTQWPLVFVEVQFQRDQWFCSQFFCEIFIKIRSIEEKFEEFFGVNFYSIRGLFCEYYLPVRQAF